MNTQEILIQAKHESNKAPYSTEEKNTALKAMAKALIDHTDDILSKNKIDIENAKNKISEVMLDRLYLDASRIKDMAKGILDVSKLPDPTGRILSTHTLENGLIVNKISVPMGVIAIIYESRPNVTSDAAALTIKAGSVCILRSGKEAWNSANAIVKALQEGLENVGMSKNRIHLIEDTTRQSSYDLMKANGYVDLLIPRGGKGLIQSVIQNATVPCIETGTGICHIYVDKDANLDKAVKIIENAKTQRPSVCNAEEVCLVHKDIAQDFLPKLKEVLVEQRKAQDKIPVELRLDPIAHQIIDGTLATDEDFDTEFLDYILAIKVVDSIEEAIEHIQEHSTHHSDAIISENEQAQTKFSSTIDSAAVYINASTRFTDGGVFGLGCEMGISTQKLHARGPMGLEELCTYKYIIKGNGQIRE
ncbi:glutamate-5-semialdehyde dehydrogenase [Faecalitalea cylindroides]|uniref:glutamate-5-semialdehyde dehydrogenase n=1 Tax=Faecalitalea cylindroides TaxID=39483 RepID=UPI0022E105DA|nr:glutamate-5-semialdehyde dehydrogenase [Faecalitalea cylindroides]